MNKYFFVFLSLILFSLVGCSVYTNPSEIAAMKTPIPYKDAETIPNSVSKNNIIIAAYIPSNDEQFRILSEKIHSDFTPVVVTITNNSKQKILFHDAFYITAGKKHTPISSLKIINTLQGHFWLTMRMFFLPGASICEAMNEKQRRDEAITINIYNKQLREKIIIPNSTYQGVLFFASDGIFSANKKISLCLRFQSLQKVKYFTINLNKVF